MRSAAIPSGTAKAAPLLVPAGESNEIKVMLDGDFLRVSAVVDSQGAKKLMKALKANIALLSDEDDESDESGD